MEFMRRNRILCIALAVQLILVIAAAWNIFLPRFFLHMEADAIPFNGGYYENEGCHVDENTGNAGYFTYGPSVLIPRGTFTITIHYETDTDTNTVACMGSNTSLNTLKYDDIVLKSTAHEQQFTLWASASVPAFQVATIYSGQGSLTIYDIDIKQTYGGSVLNLFYTVVLSVLADFIIAGYYYLKRKRPDNGKIRNFLILCAVIIFASFPLFTDYLVEGHDLIFHLLRIEGIKDGILSGQFPVKIQPTQLSGYGYAASVFYGDVFLYIPALLRLAGMPVQTAYMWFLFLVNIATVVICYISFKGIFKNADYAVCGAFLYTLSPYRLINIYGRAAVGEYTAMIFLPLLMYGLYAVFTEDVKKKEYKSVWVAAALAYTGIIQSHVLTCEITGAFTILICIILIKRVFVKERFVALVKIVVAAIVLNIGFLVPFLEYMVKKICIISDGAMTTYNIQQNGLYAARYFTAFLGGTGMPYSRKANYSLGMQGEMGVSVGAGLIICGCVFLYFMLCTEKKKGKHYRFGCMAFALSVLTLIMSLDVFPWDSLVRHLGPFGMLAGSIQFPWRLLGICSLTLSVTGVCAIEHMRENDITPKINISGVIIMIAAIVMLTDSYMLGNMLDGEKPFRAYSANAIRTDTSGTYFNEYAPSQTDVSLLDGNYKVSSDEVTVSEYSKEYLNILMQVNNASGENQYIEVPLLYYPGYAAYADGTQLQCEKGDNNVVRVIVPADFNGYINIKYCKSMAWIIAEIVSFIAFVATIIIVSRRICYTGNITTDMV